VPNSKLKNKISKSLLLSFLSSDNTFYFSCSKKSTSIKYYPSSIAKEFSFKEYNAALPFEYYSDKYANIEHAQALDLYYLFKDTSSDYFSFSKSRKLTYRTYDNSVTPLNIFDKDSNLRFSYSSLDKYYSCPFKYYLEKVVGFEEFESNFNTNFGTLAHNILEKQYNTDFDFEKEWEYQLTKFEFAKKDLILLDGLKKQVKLAVETCLKHANEFSATSRNFSESKIERKIDDKTILEGRIDRITILKEKYYYVLDYKTGKETFSPKFLDYGKSTQLPTYIILTEAHPELTNLTLVGIYINNIIDTSVKKEVLDDDTLIPSYLLLNGKTLANQQVINYIDTTFEATGPTKSSFIKGLTITKTGAFNAKSTAQVSESEFQDYRNTVFDLITAAARDIRDNKFDIAPKYFSSKEHACQYCEFKDICFKKYKQINFINSSELDIDGGIENE
jgi:ATP-dependent helicase/DNAse subunit B